MKKPYDSTKIAEMQRVCKDIAADMAADATAFDGKPFDGRTVAEYFGNQGAAIAALANMLSVVLDEAQRTEPSATDTEPRA